MALREDLEDMPVGRFHDLADTGDVVVRDVIVKKVAHGVNEDFPWTLPAKWVGQLLRYEPNIEALFKWVTGNTAKTLCKSFSIAVLASWTDF
jgi:hypothetical protein